MHRRRVRARLVQPVGDAQHAAGVGAGHQGRPRGRRAGRQRRHRPDGARARGRERRQARGRPRAHRGDRRRRGAADSAARGSSAPSPAPTTPRSRSRASAGAGHVDKAWSGRHADRAGRRHGDQGAGQRGRSRSRPPCRSRSAPRRRSACSPGADGEYTAKTDATVISTAGEATLACPTRPPDERRVRAARAAARRAEQARLDGSGGQREGRRDVQAARQAHRPAADGRLLKTLTFRVIGALDVLERNPDDDKRRDACRRRPRARPGASEKSPAPAGLHPPPAAEPGGIGRIDTMIAESEGLLRRAVGEGVELSLDLKAGGRHRPDRSASSRRPC